MGDCVLYPVFFIALCWWRCVCGQSVLPQQVSGEREVAVETEMKENKEMKDDTRFKMKERSLLVT